MITFQCPGCKARIEVPDQYQGRQARCPTCSRKLRVPKAPAPTIDSGGVPADEAASSSANMIVLEGRAYQVRPQVEGFAVAAAIVVGVSLLPLLVIGLTTPLYNPWLWAGVVAAAVALFGILLVLPAQMSITRSHGRKSGQRLTAMTLLAGTVLIVVYLTVALLSSLWTDYSSCPERLQATYAALVNYARAHDGQFPPRPETLVAEGLLRADALTCPATAGARAGRPTYLRGRDGESVIPWSQLDFKNPHGEAFPPELIILMDGGVHQLDDGQRVYYVLLMNGQVRTVTVEQRDDVLREQFLMLRRVVELRRMKEEALSSPSGSEAESPQEPAEPTPPAEPVNP